MFLYSNKCIYNNKKKKKKEKAVGYSGIAIRHFLCPYHLKNGGKGI